MVCKPSITPALLLPWLHTSLNSAHPPECEILFAPVAPARLQVIVHDVVVKVHVGALLELLTCHSWFGVALEPGIVVLVVPPALTLQLLQD